MKIVCTICARGGSKGVKNKNIRQLMGKPMIAHTIEHAKATGLFEHIVVSTDSDEIMDAARSYGAQVFFRRPAEMANDKAAKIPVIRHAFQESERHFQTQFDYLVDLDATAPLRLPEDITGAWEQFLRDDNDLLTTAMPARRSPYFNLVEFDLDGKLTLSKKPEKPIVCRQDSPKCYDFNAAVYIWKREAILKYDSLFVDKAGLYIMPPERSIDVDSEIDFQFAEFVLTKRLQREI